MARPIPSSGDQRNLQEVRRLIGADLVEQVGEIQRDLGEQTETVARATLAGDSRRLRGIPACGKGVSGHIAGTDPLEALLDKYDDEEAA